MAASVEDMDMEATEEISLIDTETNEVYKVIMSRKDATRAQNDLTFATQLLQNYEIARHSTQQIYCTLPQASTSQQKPTVSLDTTVQCAEGAHAWTKQETLLLLELYREHQTNFVGGKSTIKKHWDNIAKLMQEKGYDISGFKCSAKFQSLKWTYKRITDQNNKSGNKREDWEFLQTMQELFGDKLWVQPLAIAGSHLDKTENKIDLQDEENLPKKERVSDKKTNRFTKKTNSFTKKTKVNTLKKLLKDYLLFLKEGRDRRSKERVRQRDIRSKHHEEKLLAFKRIENLLERLIEKENKSGNRSNIRLKIFS